MARKSYLFTSESVSEGHPDKVCDRISDAVVDAYLGADPTARVACETLTTTNLIVIAGEVRGPHEVIDRVEELARNAVKSIGYDQEGFSWKNAEVQVHLHEQSSDIAQGVDADGNKAEGAGDQGIMFGYACRETSVLMPAPIHLSHQILKRLADVRHDGTEPLLAPDSKSQVTLAYEDGKPVRATSVVVSTQHDASLNQDQVKEIVRPYVEEVLPDGWMCSDDQFYVNPTGNFVIGGPDGDCWPDRPQDHRRHLWRCSTAWRRRILRQGPDQGRPLGGLCTPLSRQERRGRRLADRCSIQLAYAIGVADPLSVYVDTYGTGQCDEAALEKALRDVMDLTPRGIRDHLQLDRPIYERTAAYGHMGREPEADGGFSWEKTDLADSLKSALA